jgi:5'-deoxynucleotidase YfbR-like HD superfamily hydrolase
MTKTKIEREMKALEKLTDEYITILPGFILLLNEYEDRKSKESQFVYSLDKIQPIIQVVME